MMTCKKHSVNILEMFSPSQYTSHAWFTLKFWIMFNRKYFVLNKKNVESFGFKMFLENFLA